MPNDPQMAFGEGDGRQPSAPDASVGAAAGATAPLVLPHRAAAVLNLSLAAAGCCAATAAGGVLLRLAVVEAGEPAGQLLSGCCLALLAGYVGLGIAAWLMAASDLRWMAVGRMDPAGRGKTRAGRLIAMFVVIATVVVGVCAFLLVLMDPSEFTLPGAVQPG